MQNMEDVIANEFKHKNKVLYGSVKEAHHCHKLYCLLTNLSLTQLGFEPQCKIVSG